MLVARWDCKCRFTVCMREMGLQNVVFQCTGGEMHGTKKVVIPYTVFAGGETLKVGLQSMQLTVGRWDIIH